MVFCSLSAFLIDIEKPSYWFQAISSLVVVLLLWWWWWCVFTHVHMSLWGFFWLLFFLFVCFQLNVFRSGLYFVWLRIHKTSWNQRLVTFISSRKFLSFISLTVTYNSLYGFSFRTQIRYMLDMVLSFSSLNFSLISTLL